MGYIDALELVLFLLLALGAGLIVGAVNVAAGFGAGVLVLAVCGLVWLIAYEKGA